MSKKFLITEEEKKNIKSLYNINEQSGGDLFKDLLSDLLFGSKDEKPTDKKSKTDSTILPKTDLSNISEKGQELLNNELFKKRLSEISRKIGIDKDSIIKLMKHESGLDPTKENSIGCVGLIQFCPDNKRGSYKTITGTRYDLDELKTNLNLQMDAIEKMWVDGVNKGKIKSVKDLYIYNFFPIAAGKDDSFVLKTDTLSAQKVANSNPIFNRTLGRPRNTPLTVGDLKKFYRKTGMA